MGFLFRVVPALPGCIVCSKIRYKSLNCCPQPWPRICQIYRIVHFDSQQSGKLRKSLRPSTNPFSAGTGKPLHLALSSRQMPRSCYIRIIVRRPSTTSGTSSLTKQTSEQHVLGKSAAFELSHGWVVSSEKVAVLVVNCIMARWPEWEPNWSPLQETCIRPHAFNILPTPGSLYILLQPQLFHTFAYVYKIIHVVVRARTRIKMPPKKNGRIKMQALLV